MDVWVARDCVRNFACPRLKQPAAIRVDAVARRVRVRRMRGDEILGIALDVHFLMVKQHPAEHR